MHEIEELKHADPAESWRLLKRFKGLDGGSSPPLATVVDKNGVETGASRRARPCERRTMPWAWRT